MGKCVKLGLKREELPEKFLFERLVNTELETVVLNFLADGSLTTAKLLERIKRNFDVCVAPETLYPLLCRLEKRGLVESQVIPPEKKYKLSLV